MSTEAQSNNIAAYQASLTAQPPAQPGIDPQTQQALAIQAQNQAHAAQAAQQAPAPQGTEAQAAPQQPQVAPGATNEGEWDGDVSKLDPKVQELIRSLRGEAADKRVRLQQAEQKLTGAKTLEEFTAAQKEWVESTAAVQKEAAELQRENAALAAGLPAGWGVRLQGNTAEELKADALALAQGFQNPQAMTPPVHSRGADATGGLSPSAQTGTPRTPAEMAEIARRNMGTNLL